jgi:hypothetical protein
MNQLKARKLTLRLPLMGQMMLLNNAVDILDQGKPMHSLSLHNDLVPHTNLPGLFLFTAEAKELLAAIKVVGQNPMSGVPLPRPVFSNLVDAKGRLDLEKAAEPPKVSMPT